jgi:carbamoyl-phosphate synthase large subunit
MLKDGKIALVLNTTEGGQSVVDSFSIRRTALLGKIPYYTTIAGAKAIASAIAAINSSGGLDVRSIQSYFSDN